MEGPMALAAYVAEDGPCGASMGGEALGPVKAPCPSVGECQGQEAGVCGRAGGSGVMGVFGGETKKENNI